MRLLFGLVFLTLVLAIAGTLPLRRCREAGSDSSPDLRNKRSPTFGRRRSHCWHTTPPPRIPEVPPPEVPPPEVLLTEEPLAQEMPQEVSQSGPGLSEMEEADLNSGAAEEVGLGDMVAATNAGYLQGEMNG